MAISFAPGQVVSHEDYLALMEQHGSTGGAKSIETLPPPKMTDDELTAFEDAHDNMSPAEYYRLNPIYRYHFQDGSWLDAQADENASAEERAAGRGTLKVVKHSPSTTYTQAQTKAATAAAADDNKWYPEGTPDANQPSGFDNSRPIMARTVNGKKEYRAPNAAELKDWRDAQQMSQNPGNKTDAEIAAEAAKSGRKEGAAVTINGKRLIPVTEVTNTPQGPQERTYHIDAATRAVVDPGTAPGPYIREPVKGRPGLWVVKTTDPETNHTETHYENDDHVRVPTPVDTPQPTKTEGGYGYWDTTGPEPVWKPVAGPTRAPLPGGLPAFTPDWQKPGLGAYEHAQAIRAFQRENPGALDDDRAKELIGEAADLAQAEATRINSVLGIQRGLYGEDVSQRNTDVSAQTARRNQAASIFGNSMSDVASARGALPEGSDLAGRGGIGAMIIGARLASMMGGADVPRVQLSPALEAIRGQAIPGMGMGPQGAPALSAPPPAAPGAAELAPLAPAAPEPSSGGFFQGVGQSLPPPILRPTPGPLPTGLPQAALPQAPAAGGLFDDITLDAFLQR